MPDRRSLVRAENETMRKAVESILAIGELDADREVQVFDIVDIASRVLHESARASNEVTR